MAEHDSPYKRFFSYPEMVQDLLEGFVHQDWVSQCDFSSLELQNSSFVSEQWKSRESDVIWRIRLNGDWLYLYILLEFQSSPDAFMGLRMLGYTSLFLQHIVTQEKLSHGDKLPPVFPFVIYNGEKGWASPVQLSDLMVDMPPSLQAYQPNIRYFLLNENQCTDDELALYNLVAYLVRMELSNSHDELRTLVSDLIRCLSTKSSQTGLAADFTRWLCRSLLPAKMQGIDIPEIAGLQEVQTMLSERVTQWKDQWLHQGIEQGIEQERREIARKLRAQGIAIEQIVLITELSVEELQELLVEK